MRIMIKTVDELIDAMGGPAEVGRTYGLAISTVSGWKTRGIAGDWKLRLFLDCSKLGLEVDPAVFDLPHEEDGGGPLAERLSSVA